jgi:hypothetical protein
MSTRGEQGTGKTTGPPKYSGEDQRDR